MPELPEVVTVVAALSQKIIGKKITQIKIRGDNFIKEISPENFIAEVKNATIIDIKNHAKHILIFLDNNKVIISHLRMNGKYFTYKSAKWFAHDYLQFIFSDQSVLNYNDSRKFGTFHLRRLESLYSLAPLKNVASEPFDIDVEQFFAKLQKINKTIKAVLLDQKLIGGIGNIYADEICFATKISPLTIAKTLNFQEVKLLIENAKRILAASIKLGGSSINSYTSLNAKQGSFQNFLQVHTKVGKPCPVCQQTIVKLKVAGRGTYVCNQCQK
ncbi:DNA-formamidopyrimidine glycosylase [Mesomycoplasma conjunctivae]|uniref:DNA-formamidopyrimidine glycosylase n=1 Tax=Mesomycoplasma conjunctivae TaxID=45361 RepID=UPI003DA6AE08